MVECGQFTEVYSYTSVLLQEIKQSQQEEFLSNRQEDEMEMSEEDEGPAIKKSKRPDVTDTITNQYVESK